MLNPKLIARCHSGLRATTESSRSIRSLIAFAVFAASNICASAALALPNLTITQQASVPSTNPGQPIAYTLNVANVGPHATGGTVRIVDQLPPGVQYASTESGGDILHQWACGESNGAVTCTRSSLAANTAAPKLTINVVASNMPVGSPPQHVTNVAVVNCVQCTESSTSDNTATSDVLVGYSALSLQKLSDVTAAWIGAPYRYSLYVNNASEVADRSVVTVADTLPAGTMFAHAWGVNWGCGQAGLTITCQLADTAAIPSSANGGSASPVRIAVLAPASPQNVTNTAILTSAADATSGDNIGTNVVTAAAQPSATDLQLNSSIAIGAVPSGAPYSYTFTVKNNGPVNETGPVLLRAAIPADATIVDIAEGSGWNCGWDVIEFGVPEHLVTCQRSGLTANTTSPSVIVKALAGHEGTHKTDAWVSGTADTNTANNVRRPWKDVVASTAPDLAVFVTSNPLYPVEVPRGADYSYTLQVVNLSGTPTTGTVYVTSVLPEGVTFDHASGSGWTCSGAIGGTVTCSRTQAFSASAPDLSIHLSAPLTPGLLKMRAVVASTDGDVNPGNNVGTSLTAVFNTRPIALYHNYVTSKNQPLVLVAPGVMEGASDAEGDPLSLVRGALPLHGQLHINDDGSFLYVPDTDYQGMDSFSYRVSDGAVESNDAVATILVGNQPPQASGFGTSIPETEPVGSLLGNIVASDDGLLSPLVYTIVAGNVGGVFEIDAQTGEIRVSSGLDYETRSSYALQVAVSDGEHVATAFAAVTITDVIGGPGVENRVPVAVGDAIQVVPGGIATAVIGGATSVLWNDFDPDPSDILKASVVSFPSHGGLTLNQSGQFTYTNNIHDHSTTDSFVYRACDAQPLCAETTVTITITNGPLNQLPVAADDEIRIQAGATATVLVGGASSVLANDSDPDAADSLVASLLTQPSHGMLVFSANGDGTFSYQNDIDDPVPTDAFAYQLCDSHGACVVGHVAIDIVENTAPVVADQSFAVDESAALGTSVGTWLVIDDGLPQGASFSFAITGGNVGNAFAIDAATGEIRVNAPLDFESVPVYALVISVSDGELTATATATIAIGDIVGGPGIENTAPDVAPQVFAIAEDATPDTVVGQLLVADDGLPAPAHLTFTITTPGARFAIDANGQIAVAAPLDFENQASHAFTVSVSDGALATSATVTIDVTDVAGGPGIEPNSPPTIAPNQVFAVPEDAAASSIVGVVVATDDGQPQPLTYSIVSGNVGNAFSISPQTGALSIASPLDFETRSSYTLGISVSDGAQSGTGAVHIDVTDVVGGPGVENTTAPVASADAYTAFSDTEISIAMPGVLANDVDADGDPLVAELTTDTAHGELTFDPLGSGAFTYKPDSLFVGSDTFKYKAFDGLHMSNEVTVTITVVPKGSGTSPVAADDTFTVLGDKASFIASPGVLLNDTDQEGDLMLAHLVAGSGPTHGTLEFSEDGSFLYVPQAGYVGADNFRYTATDGNTASAIAVVSLNVVAPGGGSAPTANADTYAAISGSSLTIAGPGVLHNDSDPEGDAIAAELYEGPQHGTLVLGSDGGFTYQSDAGYVGMDGFRYRATDGLSYSPETAVSIAVASQGSGQPPHAVDDSYATPVNQTLDVAIPGVLGNDDEPEGQTMQADLVESTAHGILVLSGDGSFKYEPDSGYSGTDTFKYRATDGAAPSNVATVTITVGGSGNMPPVVAPNQDFDVAEDAPLGSVIGTVQATDDGLPQPPHLTYAIVDGNLGNAFALNADTGSLSVAGALDFESIDDYALTVSVSDGALAATAIIHVVVTDVVGGPGVENRAPVVVDDALEVAHGGSATVLTGGAASVLANDNDADGDTMAAEVTIEPHRGTLVLDVDGTFVYENTDTSATMDSFEYEACDPAGLCSKGLVTISITEAGGNHVPVAVGDEIQVAPGSMANVLASGAASVLANDTDIDHDPLHAIVIAQPVHGDLTMNADGTFVYSHHGNDPFPVDAFTYEACDSHGACSAALVTVAISPLLPDVNCVPLARVYEVGDSVLLDFTALFTAPQNQSLTYSAQLLPPSLTVDGTTGVLSGTLAASDAVGSPYPSNLRATTVPGGGTAAVHVDLVVLPAGERLFANGFDGDQVTPMCR